MGDVAEKQIKDTAANIVLTPYSGIGKQDMMSSVIDVPATAYRVCSSSVHIPSSQISTAFTPIGNSIIKTGKPKLSTHDVHGEEVSICPVILHPTKQLSPQVQMKSDTLIKTIGFVPTRSQMSSQPQSRIVTSSLHRSIVESQHVPSPLIITPMPHVIHTNNDVVPAKIVPIPPPVSHFSVINKSGSYDSIPEYSGLSRHGAVPGAPPVYTQSDFARFPPKSYHHKTSVNSSAIVHGPIYGRSEEPTITIPSNQHVFKPIISPRPSILRKRDADGVLKAQKNLIPILTKPDIEEYPNIEEAPPSRNGYGETGLQLDSIMIPQIPEVMLPQISALRSQPHIMVEISPRKKPRKQLLPVNQDSPFKIVGDEMEYVDEKVITKNSKTEEYPDEDVVECNDDCGDGDAEDEAEDDLEDNDMDVDDDCPADDYDEDDDDFGDGFDYSKSDKQYYEEVKTSTDLSDGNSSYTKKNVRPTLLGSIKNTWRGHNHHFQRYTDFKIKETKKQIAEMQQIKKWTSDSRSGWRIRLLLRQFDGMVKIERDIIERMNDLINMLEENGTDLDIRHALVELIRDNIQRSKVTRDQLEEVSKQLSKLFEYKALIEDVVDKYCPKELKKKSPKVQSTVLSKP